MEIGPPSKPSFLRDAFQALAFRFLGANRWHMLSMLFYESRCFLGNLRTQFAKGPVSVHFGPSFELDPHLKGRNKRTLARMRGIGNLLAIYPWAAHRTFEIFLMGFDAGEQWALDNQDSKPHHDQCEPNNTSATGKDTSL